MKKSGFTFIDLFSGIGGFRMALEQLGGECLHFSEINADAVNTYCTNFDESSSKNLGDITKIKGLPSHSLLTGGVPCQSWSIAGKNLGFDDDRGQLWNDTLYLLNQAKPDAFIFENVKGLVDPRNKTALSYILNRIREAGYHAKHYVLNSFDYGVPQNRVRIYIVGFRSREFYLNFKLPRPIEKKIRLADILVDFDKQSLPQNADLQRNLFGEIIQQKSMSLSASNGLNDYFLFNDIRNGHSTIHSWDILEATERQKDICYLLLKNRRKSAYGPLDGNPLSLAHFIDLDKSILQIDLDHLEDMGIVKGEPYAFDIVGHGLDDLQEDERLILEACDEDNKLIIDNLKMNRTLKIKNISITKTISELIRKKIIVCSELRYDFKNSKISTGLNGVSRIFLPTSNIFPTLVASDTNDFVTTEMINAKNELDYKKQFIERVFRKGNYRRITKEEACAVQGFPSNFKLPENRARWMRLIGNSVSVPVIKMLGEAVLETGVFDNDQSEKSAFDLDGSLELRKISQNAMSNSSFAPQNYAV